MVNLDWPVEASPDSLYEGGLNPSSGFNTNPNTNTKYCSNLTTDLGFGAKDYFKVDPLLGTDEDWVW